MTTSSNRIRVLLIVLGAAAAVGQPAPTRAEEVRESVGVNPQSLKYIQIPDMPHCATAAILRGNPRSGPAWVLLKLTSGCRVPWHRHTANEDLVAISGQGTLAMKDGPPLKIVPGAFASLPSGHIHQASCSRTCLFFSIADAAFDIHYVDANGEDISAEKALKQSAGPKAKKK